MQIRVFSTNKTTSIDIIQTEYIFRTFMKSNENTKSINSIKFVQNGI